MNPVWLMGSESEGDRPETDRSKVEARSRRSQPIEPNWIQTNLATKQEGGLTGGVSVSFGRLKYCVTRFEGVGNVP